MLRAAVVLLQLVLFVQTVLAVNSRAVGRPAFCPPGLADGAIGAIITTICRNDTETSVSTDSQTSATASCPDSNPTVLQCLVIGDNGPQSTVINTTAIPQTCTATCPAGVACTIHLVCR